MNQMNCSPHRFYKISNPRIHDFTKFCVYNLDAMLGGIRKIAELQESGQKLTKPRIGLAIIKLLEAPLNIGSKSLVHLKFIQQINELFTRSNLKFQNLTNLIEW